MTKNGYQRASFEYLLPLFCSSVLEFCARMSFLYTATLNKPFKQNMPRKLTPAQSDSIRKQTGLFDAVLWGGCLSYLHALLSCDDPSNTEPWMTAMQLIKVFIEWALQQARLRFGPLGYECLYHASTKEMQPELEHPLHEAKCVFSGRTHLDTFSTPSHPEPQVIGRRVQRKFSWWAHHEQTGLESPHTSASYVYESQYSYLVLGMYTLGHLGAILKHHSRACGLQVSLAEFQSNPVWAELYVKINMILYVVHEQLVS